MKFINFYEKLKLEDLNYKTWLLLSFGYMNIKNSEGWTLLNYAAKDEHLEVIKILLKSGADINSTRNGGFTSLIIATMYGNEKSVKLLLENGADVCIRDEFKLSALSYSNNADSAKTKIKDLLISYGAGSCK